MFVGRTSRTELLVSALFGKPILTWTGVHDRFFASIYDQLGSILSIRADDFSITNALSPGDAKVTFRIFGGASSIVLTSDRVDFLFPSFAYSDWPLVLQIIEKGQAATVMAQEKLTLRQMHFLLQEHIQLLDNGKTDDFIARHASPDVQDKFSSSYEGYYEAGLKFRFVDTAQHWHVDILAERSQLVSNGIFIRLDAWINDLSTFAIFADQHALFHAIYGTALAAISMELRNEPISPT